MSSIYKAEHVMLGGRISQYIFINLTSVMSEVVVVWCRESGGGGGGVNRRCCQTSTVKGSGVEEEEEEGWWWCRGRGEGVMFVGLLVVLRIRWWRGRGEGMMLSALLIPYLHLRHQREIA